MSASPVLLCSLNHLLVTTATALELLLPQLGLAVAIVSPELKLAGEDMMVVVVLGGPLSSHISQRSVNFYLRSIRFLLYFGWRLAVSITADRVITQYNL